MNPNQITQTDIDTFNAEAKKEFDALVKASGREIGMAVIMDPAVRQFVTEHAEIAEALRADDWAIDPLSDKIKVTLS